MFINRGTVLGNITADAELKQTKEQKPYITFTVATNHEYMRGTEKVEQVEYHYMVVYGQLAVTLSNVLLKGKRVFCEGRMQTSRYRKTEQDPWSYKHTIVCDKVILLDKKEKAPEPTPISEDNLFF